MRKDTARTARTGRAPDDAGNKAWPDDATWNGDVGESYCTCAMLRRASRRVTQVYDHALKPLGLRLTQYSLLANIARSGGLTITELAERLAMERTTLTRNLHPLESAGWIRVEPGADRRSRAVEITTAGEAVIERAVPAWQQAERELRRAMGQGESAELRRLLAVAMKAVPMKAER